MIIILSPSKTQDFSQEQYNFACTLPRFRDETMELVMLLRGKTELELATLMGISDKLASLNYERYQQFSQHYHQGQSKPAILSFKGDVYDGIDVGNYAMSDFNFTQNHLRILSGLYGLIRPLDLIQPYRLEMGIKLRTAQGKDLYSFWGDKLTEALNQEDSRYLINLASNEYFSAINTSRLNTRLINVTFKESNGKVVGLFAKKARGLMANYLIKNKISLPELIKEFTVNGYKFNDKASNESEYVFTR